MIALGDTIADLKRQAAAAEDPSGTLEIEDIFNFFQSSLNQQLARASMDLFRHIPCHIFHVTSHTSDFSIGPVHFTKRAAWADRHVGDAKIRREVKRAWAGKSDDGKPELTQREQLQINSIVNTVGQHGWVGTVLVQEHDFDNSYLKANVLVGLGLDALGVALEAQEAALLNRAGIPFFRGGSRLATTTDGKMFGGGTARLPGLRGHPTWADRFLAETAQFLQAAGQILTAYAEAHQSGAEAPWLIERWGNALHWFGEARRESSDFMAVVKYGCALDILTGAGGNLDSMARYVERALGMTEAIDQARKPVPLRDLINNVFNDGRSALAHGEAFGLLADRAVDRVRADIIVQRLILAVTEPLGSIVHQNDRMLTIGKDAQVRAFEARLDALAKRRQP